MSNKQLKILTGVFGMSVIGIAFSLVMSIVTAVQQHQAAQVTTPISIPTPAMGS